MTELSPQAQAVWDAAYNTPEDCPYEHDLAAALRAAADRVAPEEREPYVPDFPNSDQIAPYHEWLDRRKIRSEILSIADELDAQ